MEKEQIQPIEADHADSLQDRDERVEDVEAVQHIHLKTIILLIVRFFPPHTTTPTHTNSLKHQH